MKAKGDWRTFKWTKKWILKANRISRYKLGPTYYIWWKSTISKFLSPVLILLWLSIRLSLNCTQNVLISEIRNEGDSQLHFRGYSNNICECEAIHEYIPNMHLQRVYNLVQIHFNNYEQTNLLASIVKLVLEVNNSAVWRLSAMIMIGYDCLYRLFYQLRNPDLFSKPFSKTLR